jgi:hypothetical protein
MLLLSADDTFWSLFSSIAEGAADATFALESVLRDPSRAETIVQATIALRERCSDRSRAAKRKLGRSWITPLDRGEIHALATSLDALVDAAAEATARCAMFAPGPPSPEIVDLAGCARRATKDVQSAVQLLGPKLEPARIAERCHVIAGHRGVATTLANSAVAQYVTARTASIVTLRWTEVARAIAVVPARAERVAFVLEAIAMEHG